MIVLKGRVIDGTGGAPIEKGMVVIEDNKISLVCKDGEYTVPENAELIEVKDGTIMPGFIEQHTHIGMCTANFVDLYLRHPYTSVCMAVDELMKMQQAGFTTIRECGGFTEKLKEPSKLGVIDVPRIMSSGKIITQTGGHADYIKRFPRDYHEERIIHSCIVDGVDEMRRECRLHLRENADFIKIMTSAGVTDDSNSVNTQEFCDAEVRAAVEEAENYGTYVSSHCISNAGIKLAVRNGVKSIEHAMFLDEEAVEMIVKSGAWIVPTFAIAQCYMNNLDNVPEYVARKIQTAYDAHYKSFDMARKAGIKLGFGCDFVGDYKVCPNGPNGMEFERLVAAGMTPMEAIVAATKTGSEICMMEDKIGTLEKGKLADVVVAAGNPLENIKILVDPENIKVVIRDGQIKKNKA